MLRCSFCVPSELQSTKRQYTMPCGTLWYTCRLLGNLSCVQTAHFHSGTCHLCSAAVSAGVECERTGGMPSPHETKAWQVPDSRSSTPGNVVNIPCQRIAKQNIPDTSENRPWARSLTLSVSVLVTRCLRKSAIDCDSFASSLRSACSIQNNSEGDTLFVLETWNK